MSESLKENKMSDYKIGIDLALKDMASGELATFKQKISDIKPDFRAVGVAAGAASVAMGMLGKTAMDVSIQFQEALAEVSTIVDTTKIDIGAMGDQVIALSQKVPQSAALLTRGLYEVISADIDASKAMGVLEVAAKAATAGLTTTEVAVDGITTVLNAYGMEAEEAGRISDIAFETVKRGKLRFEEFASSIGTVATPAAVAGVSIEEVAAAIATMTKKGLDAATATTYLRGVLMSILSPASESKKIAKALGIDFSAAGLKAKGLSAFLRDISAAAKGNTDVLTTLFGDVRAFTGVLTISGEGAKSFESDLKGMYGAIGQTQQALDKMMATHGATLTILKNTWENFLITIGDIFLPLVGKVAVAMSGVLILTKAWIDDNKSLVGVVGGVGVAVVALTAGVAALGLLLPSIIVGMKAIGILFSSILPNAIGATKIALISLATNPLTWLAVAAGILAGEFLKLKSGTDKAIESHNQHITSISGLVDGYNNLTTGALAGTASALDRQKKIIGEIKTLLPEYSSQLDTISRSGKITAKDIKGINQQIINQYNATLHNMTMLETTGRQAGSFLKRVGSSLLGIGQLIATGIIAIFEMLGTTVDSYVEAIVSMIMKFSTNIADMFMSIFSGDWKKVKAAGEALGSSFGGGIKEGFLVSTGSKIVQDWKNIMSDFGKDAGKIYDNTMNTVYGKFLTGGMPVKPKLLEMKDMLPTEAEVKDEITAMGVTAAEGISVVKEKITAAVAKPTVNMPVPPHGGVHPPHPMEAGMTAVGAMTGVGTATVPISFGAQPQHPMAAGMEVSAPLVPDPIVLETQLQQAQTKYDTFFAAISQGAMTTQTVFNDSIAMLSGTFATNINAMISGTKNFGQAVTAVWKDLKAAVIQCISEMVAKMIAMAAIKSIFGAFGIPIPSFQTAPGEYKVVPGAPSTPQIIQAHGGEVVGRPAPQLVGAGGGGGGQNITVNLNPAMMFGGDANQMANAIKGLFREHDLMANKGLTTNYIRKI
ncbi:phage tail tape measure protein [Patescibacteria group bacterium]|nr:phage tail tape measure protein [Patescibacteria group bacterium]